jgi:hypothetical protein
LRLEFKEGFLISLPIESLSLTKGINLAELDFLDKLA